LGFDQFADYVTLEGQDLFIARVGGEMDEAVDERSDANETTFLVSVSVRLQKILLDVNLEQIVLDGRIDPTADLALHLHLPNIDGQKPILANGFRKQRTAAVGERYGEKNARGMNSTAEAHGP